MDFLYEQINFLPEVMQGPTLAFLLIIVGYFLSKIFSALATKVMPARFSKVCFWMSWLVFIVLAYTQIPLLNVALSKWKFSSVDITTLTTIGIAAALLMTGTPLTNKFLEVIIKYLNYIPQPNLNTVLKSILYRIAFVIIIVTASFALSSPKTITLRVIASILVSLFGLLLAKVIQEVITGIVDTHNGKSHFLLKVLFYFVLATFIVTLPEIWQS